MAHVERERDRYAVAPNSLNANSLGSVDGLVKSKWKNR